MPCAQAAPRTATAAPRREVPTPWELNLSFAHHPRAQRRAREHAVEDPRLFMGTARIHRSSGIALHEPSRSHWTANGQQPLQLQSLTLSAPGRQPCR